jgi:predicted secreted protein
MKKKMIRYFAAAAILIIAGCGMVEEVFTAKITGDSTLKVWRWQTVKIELESNPTTGYSWEMASVKPEGFFKDPIVSEYVRGGNNLELTGAGGTHIFTLKPARGGKAVLEVVYRRPWEPKTEFAKKYKIVFIVR